MRRTAAAAERNRRTRRPAFAAVAIASFVTLAVTQRAVADEGGVPFWASGQYASFAAVPQDPGWYLPALVYYYGASASRSKAFQRGGTITAGLDTKLPLLFLTPTFVPDVKVLGGRPSFSLAFGAGYNTTSVGVSSSISGAPTANRSDSRWGMSDLYPVVSLAWNMGIHNWMVYATGDIPAGSYDGARLANLGIGHGAADAGGGYTYLNTKTGLEISGAAGMTYNLVNGSTHYRNGLDLHLDYAISQFLSKHLHVGIAGYLYNQITGDSGSGASLGGFESQVAALGVEGGYFFTVAGRPFYANVRPYYEFWTEHRVGGFSLFAAMNIPLSSKEK